MIIVILFSINSFMKYLFSILLLSLLFLYSCAVKNYTLNKTPKITENGQIWRGQIVSKTFVSKGGKVTESRDLYFRLSVKDYFIKFCESDVTFEQIEPFINNEFEIKSVTLEIEIKDGEWDNCNVPGYVQSRTGPYIVINKILN